MTGGLDAACEPENGAGTLSLGWQFAPALADPGPPPARQAVPPEVTVDPGWMAAQRRLYRVAARPAMAGLAGSAAVASGLAAAWLAGVIGSALAAGGLLAAAIGSVACTGSLAGGRRRLAGVLAAERDRVSAVARARDLAIAAAQREHASAYRAWQRRCAIFGRQPAWFAVTLPPEIDRVDVAGGTLAGWSAMVTAICAPRLAVGGEATVVDLTEGAVAGDLIALAARSGIQPLVWVLPGDLPRLDLGTGLDAPAMADVLAVAAAAADGPGAGAGAGDRAGGPPADCALLERVLGILPPEPPIAQLTAALRALAGVGDPRADLRAGLISAGQLDRLATLFGREARDRVVADRALHLEARLRGLDWLGAGQPPDAPSRLRVAALDRRCGVIGNRMIGAYLVAALTHLLRQASPGQPWERTLCVLGAERFGGDLLDRLADAAEYARSGLVLAYRAIPAAVRERLGRGNAAIAVMRLGNGDDARAASELIGTEHRLVLSQLTETVGTSVTDTWGDSYTSTAGTSDTAAGSYSVSTTEGASRGRGRSRPSDLGPFGSFSSSVSRDASRSAGESGSLSLTEGINSSTSWGTSTSKALGGNESAGRTVQRSREFLVEAGELQRLPASAMIVSYPSTAGRTVLLADANPAIAGLPTVAW